MSKNDHEEKIAGFVLQSLGRGCILIGHLKKKFTANLSSKFLASNYSGYYDVQLKRTINERDDVLKALKKATNAAYMLNHLTKCPDVLIVPSIILEVRFESFTDSQMKHYAQIQLDNAVSKYECAACGMEVLGEKNFGKIDKSSSTGELLKKLADGVEEKQLDWSEPIQIGLLSTAEIDLWNIIAKSGVADDLCLQCRRMLITNLDNDTLMDLIMFGEIGEAQHAE